MSETSLKAAVTHARIVQIVPLPPGWHRDDWNRVTGIALVEIETEDGRVHTDTFFLGEDASLDGAPEEVFFAAHYFGIGDRQFAHYGGPDWEPADLRRSARPRSPGDRSSSPRVS